MRAVLSSGTCDSVINCLRSGRIFYSCIHPKDFESHSQSELQLNAKAYVKSQSHFSCNPQHQKRKRVLAEVINPTVPPTYISSPADPPPPPLQNCRTVGAVNQNNHLSPKLTPQSFRTSPYIRTNTNDSKCI